MEIGKRDASKRRKALRKSCLIAVFAALSFVANAFLAIPYPGGSGFFCFGDCFALLSGGLFGPFVGAAVGMISGVGADLYAGSAIFIPFTLLAKGCLGAIPYALMRLSKSKILAYSSFFIAGIAMALCYLPSYLIYFGAPYLVNSAFDLIQGLGCAAVSAILYAPLSKALKP